MGYTDLVKRGALNLIEKYQPISIYQLHKKLKMAYSTVWNLVKQLEKDDKITVEEKRIRIIKLLRIKKNE